MSARVVPTRWVGTAIALALVLAVTSSPLWQSCVTHAPSLRASTIHRSSRIRQVASSQMDVQIGAAFRFRLKAVQSPKVEQESGEANSVDGSIDPRPAVSRALVRNLAPFHPTVGTRPLRC